MCTPDWMVWFDQNLGTGTMQDDWFSATVGLASNVIVGTNPLYTIQDFLTLYPKWGGTPINPQASTTANSNQVVLSAPVTNPASLLNALIADGLGIFPDGTYIQSVASDAKTLTVSAQAAVTNPDVMITIWNAPLIPFFVLQLYINLANASLMQARWLEQWPAAMGLYIAHFATLWELSDGSPQTTAGQVAAAGIGNGIQVSKGAGDVTVSYAVLSGLDDWGAWNLTKYGQMLATLAKVVGGESMLIW